VELVESLVAFDVGSLLLSEPLEDELLAVDSVEVDSLLSEELVSPDLDLLSDESFDPFSTGRLGRP
jgi:hypothetical protein